MRFVVKRQFRLKPANTKYRRGDVFETKSELLVEHLKQIGMLGRRLPDPTPAPKPSTIEAVVKPEPIYPINLGGGWCQLSDGSKVRKSQIESNDAP